MDKVHRCCCCLSLRAGVFLTSLFPLIYTLIYVLSSNSELTPTYPKAHSISSQQEFRTGYNHFEESQRLIRYYKMHQWFELVYTPVILIYGFLRAFYFDKELKDSTTKLQENLRDEDALSILWFYIFIIIYVIFITLASFCYQYLPRDMAVHAYLIKNKDECTVQKSG
ncbi:MAG: hypothetical protein EXX96DRAFT_607564 [Benjaminiella poitrasii]|nr:MAG: hypothetical protein EXX96DRAFT_607564 [Benjaminiella poitrasii]